MGFYDFDVRVLVCDHCSAPIQAPSFGGEVRCEYCQSANRVRPREEALLEPIMAAESIDEEERLKLLRQQDDGEINWVLMGFQSLLDDQGKIPKWKVQESHSVWKESLSRLEKAPDSDLAEKFWVLTYKLAKYYEENDKQAWVRGIYERALDVLTLPRHRQAIRCFLAQHAALSGDVESAEKWLAPCNPRSTDLQADTDYRIARACIDTIKEEWGAVLVTLGRSCHDVPTKNSDEFLATAFRANALEKSGDFDAAIREVADCYSSEDRSDISMHYYNATGKHTLQLVQENYAQKGVLLCESCGLEKLGSAVRGDGNDARLRLAIDALQIADQKQRETDFGASTQVLLNYLREHNRFGRKVLEVVSDVYNEAGALKCSTSVEAALEKDAELRRANAKSTDNMGPVGRALSWTSLILGGVMLCASFLVLMIFVFVSGEGAPEAAIYSINPVGVFVSVMLLLVGAVFLILGIYFIVKLLRAKRIVRGGVEVEAEVAKMEPTNTKIDGVRVLDVGLKMHESHNAESEVSVRVLSTDCDQLVVGDTVGVLLDPKDRKYGFIVV